MLDLEERFYTSTEVAEILGVSLRSIYRYLDEDKLMAEIKTVTGRHRFTRKNILDFLYPEGIPEDKKAAPTASATSNQTTAQTQQPVQNFQAAQPQTQATNLNVQQAENLDNVPMSQIGQAVNAVSQQPAQDNSQISQPAVVAVTEQQNAEQSPADVTVTTTTTQESVNVDVSAQVSTPDTTSVAATSDQLNVNQQTSTQAADLNTSSVVNTQAQQSAATASQAAQVATSVTTTTDPQVEEQAVQTTVAQTQPVVTQQPQQETVTQSQPQAQVSAPAQAQAVAAQDTTQAEAAQNSSSEEDASVDWLAKFRAAAAKYKEEADKADAQEMQNQPAVQAQSNVQDTNASTVTPQPVVAQPQVAQQQPVVAAQSTSTATPQPEPVAQTQVQQPVTTSQPVQNSTVVDASETAKPQPVVAPAPKQEEAPAVQSQPEAPKFQKFNYYKSGVGGLKDIAQQLHSSASKSGLNYAFTACAGLSLYKPIKPFSLLHAYVKPEDKDFFERMLKLSSSDENGAQLCLILSDDSSVYSNAKKMHNLNVVDDTTLKNDLIAQGEQELAYEFAND